MTEQLQTSRPDHYRVKKSHVNRSGGGALLIGGTVLVTLLATGAFNSHDNASQGATATPEASAAGASPSGSSEASPSASPSGEVSTFTPRETNTAEGWNRATLELIDGTKIDVDRLDYQTGTKATLFTGAVINGDTNLDGVFTTDSNAQTGSIILNQKEGAVLDSKYGLSVYENFDPKYTDQVIQAVKKDMLANGCGLKDGCKEAIIQIYGADGKLIPYDASKVSAQPAASPKPGETTPPVAGYDFSGMTKDQEINAINDLLFTSKKVDPNSEEGIALTNLLRCLQCASVSCAVPTEPAPSASPTPTPSSTAEVCVPGFDRDDHNIYLGNLAKLKVYNNPEYLFKINGGEKYAIQGDVEYVKDGILHQNFDTGKNSGNTGAVSYFSIPEGESITIYMVNGGDVHKLDSCTTEAQARELVQGYISGMEIPNGGPYKVGNVKEYDVK
jgi:hypothetical protein